MIPLIKKLNVILSKYSALYTNFPETLIRKNENRQLMRNQFIKIFEIST